MKGRHLPAGSGLRAVSLRLAMVVMVWASAASPAWAASSQPTLTRLTPVTRGSTYLALGDSVTFGYQEPNVIPAPNFLRAASFRGYPEQLGAALHLKVTNLACPGETAASLVNFTAPSNGCENAYRANFPLHVRYKGSQLAYAVAYLRKHSGVRLVSLMIGANDLFRCQRTTTDACLATLAEISRSVKRILSAIRNRAHYAGQLAIVDYYSLNYSNPLINSQSMLLNHAVNAAARPFHVETANGYGEYRKASVRFGQQPCLAGLITQLNGQVGSCGVHPTYAGQALLAQALERAVRF